MHKNEWDVIIHSYSNLSGGLDNSSFTLGHGWVILPSETTDFISYHVISNLNNVNKRGLDIWYHDELLDQKFSNDLNEIIPHEPRNTTCISCYGSGTFVSNPRGYQLSSHEETRSRAVQVHIS